ncbi:hypothetical protein PAMH27_4787 [Pseudomonas aeruginosa MH27]|nr:hypothetical protein PAMH27_4787 [Pseudomonas aeruginosa MH27]
MNRKHLEITYLKACFLFTLPNPSWHVLFRV